LEPTSTPKNFRHELLKSNQLIDISGSFRPSYGVLRSGYDYSVWLVSVLVIVPILYILSGRQLPDALLDQLETYLPKDAAPSRQLLAVGCLAGVFVAASPFHKLARYLPTVVHELGHAFTAGVLGGRPKNITISLDTSGLAQINPPITWGRFRATLFLLAGYPASSIAALAAIMITRDGHPQAWFAFAGATLAVSIVLLIRNLWGLLWTLAAVAGSYFGSPLIPLEWIGAVVGGIGGYLALEAYRHAFMQLAIIRKFPGSGADAEKVARLWKINAPFLGFVHLLSVAAIGLYAVYLAVNPYSPELIDWITGILQTR